MPTHTVNTQHFRQAKSLLRALSPNFGAIISSPSNTVYRGHRHESFLLLPAAFRSDTTLLSGAGWAQSGSISSEVDHARAEMETIVSFMDVCDREGLRVPEDSQDFRERIGQIRSDFSAVTSSFASIHDVGWPPRFVWSAMALAQHYTIPTRMLDWSYSPYVAAYFAAVGAASAVAKRQMKPAERLAIWAIEDVEAMRLHELDMQPWPSRMRLVDAPTCDNDNLRAQKGCFLVRQDLASQLFKPAIRMEYTDSIVSFCNLVGKPTPVFHKLTLAASQSGKLLRLLHNEGFDAATIYPGPEGAAKAVLERQLW